MAYGDLKKRCRADYGFHLDYRTRWYPDTALLLPFYSWSITRQLRSDNDMYDHLNNSIYSFLYAASLVMYHRAPAKELLAALILSSTPT